MPKNIFFMSFLYVFIACAFFIASTVHSTSIKADTLNLAFRNVKAVAAAGDSAWHRQCK